MTALISRLRSPRPGARLVVVTAVLAVGLLVIKLSVAGAGADTTGPAPPSVAAALAAVPAATFDAVGVGLARNPPTPIQGSPLKVAGKPEVLYVGGIFCPYCAAERWPLVVALARFGSFGGLLITTSAGNDAYPNTASLSFAQATYTSSYLSFSGLEQRDRVHRQRQKPSPDQQALINAFDNVPGHADHPVPFVDLGNVFRLLGAQFDPGVLKGLSAGQVAGALAGGGPVARAVVGSANVLTAALCQLTGGAPQEVCASSGVRRAAAVIAR